MASLDGRQASNTTTYNYITMTHTQAPAHSFRRQSSNSSASSATSHTSIPSLPSRPPSFAGPSPRVQLIPHGSTISFDTTLTDSERRALDNTNFDELDLSSQDFDFEDIFTYDRPQQKLQRVVEVSSPNRQRDWSTFSFSHYPSATAMRQKVNRHRATAGVGEMYTKNNREARKK